MRGRGVSASWLCKFRSGSGGLIDELISVPTAAFLASYTNNFVCTP